MPDEHPDLAVFRTRTAMRSVCAEAVGQPRHRAGVITATLLRSTGALSGAFAGVRDDADGFADGVDFALQYDYDLGTVTVQIAAVPEPETWSMLLAGLGLLGWAARRRAKRRSQCNPCCPA